MKTWQTQRFKTYIRSSRRTIQRRPLAVLYRTIRMIMALEQSYAWCTAILSQVICSSFQRPSCTRIDANGLQGGVMCVCSFDRKLPLLITMLGHSSIKGQNISLRSGIARLRFLVATSIAGQTDRWRPYHRSSATSLWQGSTRDLVWA